MLIVPAIDLRGGKVVRLVKGDFAQETVFGDDPLDFAKHWVELGAKRLHLVDLEGAKSGVPHHLEIIEKIARAVRVPVQVGGGIRTEKVISEYLDLGVSHVILGTKACNDEKFVGKAIRDFGSGKVFAAVDVKKKDGVVSVTTGGWLNQEAVEPADLVERLVTQGIRTIIYTDVARDGTMSGPAIESYRKILKKMDRKAALFASGGVSSLNDLLKLKELEPAGLTGVVVGRALYEKTIDLKEAIQRVG